LKAKDRAKVKMLEYLGNPENDFPTRMFINSNILQYKDPTYIYKLFTLEELNEIEAEALEIRRKKYKPQLAKADKKLFEIAHDGDVSAIKLCYQRFEEWSEKQQLSHNIDGKLIIEVVRFNGDSPNPK
jgi:hypothetical protein